MKRDIRKLFEKDDFKREKLPVNHREEFIQKLRKTKIKKSKKKRTSSYWNAAASIVLVLSIGYFVLNTDNNTPNKPSELELQVQQIEKDYLKQINDEWHNFIKITKDQKLIDRYKEKLDNLDNNYKELSKTFKESPNNINVLEDLISNLQTRLQLLKDIQNHIKILNQEKRQYENSTL